MSAQTDEGWTSIPVRPSTRDKVGDIKRDGESWTDALERLLQENAAQGNA
jgi:hypothetical protein